MAQLADVALPYWIAEAQRLRERTLTCCSCRLVLPDLAALQEHTKVCEQHPVSAANREVTHLRELLAQCRALLVAIDVDERTAVSHPLLATLDDVLCKVPRRCTAYPKGERCALEEGHEGGHKWGRGD